MGTSARGFFYAWAAIAMAILPSQQLGHKREPKGVQARAGGQDIGHIAQPDKAENMRQKLVRELKERARHLIGPVSSCHGFAKSTVS